MLKWGIFLRSIVVPVFDTRGRQWSESYVLKIIHEPQVVGACCSCAQTAAQVIPSNEL